MLFGHQSVLESSRCCENGGPEQVDHARDKHADLVTPSLAVLLIHSLLLNFLAVKEKKSVSEKASRVICFRSESRDKHEG